MASTNVTYSNYQTARQRLSTSRASHRSQASPYPLTRPATPRLVTPRPAPPILSHDPPIGELFAALLFDRQRAYQSRSKPAMVSRKPKTTTNTPKKRAVPARLASQTTAKRQKTSANSKQKLDHKGDIGNRLTTTATTKPDKDTEIIVISDSEDEEPHPTRQESFSAPKINIHKDDDVKPSVSSHTPNREPDQYATNRTPLVALKPAPTWAFSRLDVPESQSDLHHGSSGNGERVQNDTAHSKPENEHDKEKEQLRKELDAVKTQLNKMKSLFKKEKGNNDLMQVQSSNIARQATERLQEELETARSNLRAVIKEKDQQRIEADSDKAKNDQLATELQEERRLREEERKEHERAIDDIIKAKGPTSDSANDSLVAENRRLQAENDALRAAAAAAAIRPSPTPHSPFLTAPPSILTPPSSQLSQSSRHPSIFASQAMSPARLSPTPCAPGTATQDRKEENIRKVYLRVKNQFDTLQFAAVNLIKSTRGMELDNFGQFGKHMRQLRKVLEDDVK